MSIAANRSCPDCLEGTFHCYPCARGNHGECSGIAWQPDVPCECAHA